MTLVDFYNATQQQLREHLLAERRRLETQIRAAAIGNKMEEVDDLRLDLDDVNDDLTRLTAVVLAQAVASRLTLPQLPPDFDDILAKGEADLEKWQKVQGLVQQTISVAGTAATAVSTIAQLVLKYGKFLI